MYSWSIVDRAHLSATCGYEQLTIDDLASLQSFAKHSHPDFFSPSSLVMHENGLDHTMIPTYVRLQRNFLPERKRRVIYKAKDKIGVPPTIVHL